MKTKQISFLHMHRPSLIAKKLILEEKQSRNNYLDYIQDSFL